MSIAMEIASEASQWLIDQSLTYIELDKWTKFPSCGVVFKSLNSGSNSLQHFSNSYCLPTGLSTKVVSFSK